MVMVGFKGREKDHHVPCLHEADHVAGVVAQDDMAAIWEHSLTVAHAAKTRARRGGIEKVFAISIVHDIGLTISYTYDDRYRSLAKEVS